MSVIALGSAKAAPGVTTTVVALAAAWPADRKVLIVEADPDGGVLGARHQLTAEPGLSTLAVSSRRSLTAATLADHVQLFSSADVTALVGPPAAEQSRRALGLAARPLAHLLPQLERTDVLIDAGRLRPDSQAAPLVETADALLFVARPRLDELQQLPARIRALRSAAPRVGMLLVGDRPYPPSEVAVALDTDVVAVLADDPRAAETLVGRARATTLARSTLMRSMRNAVEAIRAWPPTNTPTDHQEATHPAAPDGTWAGSITDMEAQR